MVACQLPKLNARVRFPLPAPKSTCRGHVAVLERAARERSGDSCLSVFRRLGLAVVAQLFIGAETGPLAGARPVMDQPPFRGDPHEPRIGADVRKIRPEQK